MAKGSKIKKDNARIYTILGDGEKARRAKSGKQLCLRHSKKLNNLIGFTDYNKLQIDGSIEEVVGLEPLDMKWKSFGWGCNCSKRRT